MQSLSSAEMSPLAHGYEGFVAYLHDPEVESTALSPKRFSEALDLDLQTLADLAHVHRDTLTRAPDSESVQRFLCEALGVLRAGFDLSCDIQKTAFWYRAEPLPAFDYKTAERLISEGRTDDVLHYIASIEAGPWVETISLKTAAYRRRPLPG